MLLARPRHGWIGLNTSWPVSVDSKKHYFRRCRSNIGENMKTQLTNENSELLRLKQIVGSDGLIPVSRSTWYNWVRTGKAPQPIRLGLRVTAWRKEDIHNFICNMSDHEVVAEKEPPQIYKPM